MIQYRILQMNITRAVWQTVRRITEEILGVKGLALAEWVTWLECRFFKSINNLINLTIVLSLLIILLVNNWFIRQRAFIEI